MIKYLNLLFFIIMLYFIYMIIKINNINNSLHNYNVEIQKNIYKRINNNNAKYFIPNDRLEFCIFNIEQITNQKLLEKLFNNSDIYTYRIAALRKIKDKIETDSLIKYISKENNIFVLKEELSILLERASTKIIDINLIKIVNKTMNNYLNIEILKYYFKQLFENNVLDTATIKTIISNEIKIVKNDLDCENIIYILAKSSWQLKNDMGLSNPNEFMKIKELLNYLQANIPDIEVKKWFNKLDKLNAH